MRHSGVLRAARPKRFRKFSSKALTTEDAEIAEEFRSHVLVYPSSVQAALVRSFLSQILCQIDFSIELDLL